MVRPRLIEPISLLYLRSGYIPWIPCTIPHPNILYATVFKNFQTLVYIYCDHELDPDPNFLYSKFRTAQAGGRTEAEAAATGDTVYLIICACTGNNISVVEPEPEP
jgi:hypothetical protein